VGEVYLLRAKPASPLQSLPFAAGRRKLRQEDYFSLESQSTRAFRGRWSCTSRRRGCHPPGPIVSLCGRPARR